MSFVLLATLALLLFMGRAWAQVQEPIIGEPSDEASCHNACTALVNELSEIVHYGPISELKGFTEGYHTAFQRDIVPACVVTPSTSKDVSAAITVLRSYPCPIAIKSGGHAATAGMSNVAGGVTIDLKLLNTVEYLGAKDWDETPSGKGKDKWKGQVTRIGTGNLWKRVYEELERFNVSVVGGRAATVGVGGFVLGGGISFLSQEHGWAMDTVRNFEVVLPNGTLTNVNHRSYPTLYKALRGGGNNFGIVTRFDMETFPQGHLWGGYSFYFPSPKEITQRRIRLGVSAPSALTFDQLTHYDKVLASIGCGLIRLAGWLEYNPSINEFFKAFEASVLKQDADLHSHQFWSFSYVKELDTFLVGGQLMHTKGEAWPKVFKEFEELKKPLYSTARVASIMDLANEVEKWSDVGPRQVWLATTLRVTPTKGHSTTSLHELLSLCADIFIQEMDNIKHVRGIIPSMTFQPINLNELRKFGKNGGNAIGIKVDEGPLVMLSVTFFYNSRPRRAKWDDPLVRKTAESIMYRWQMMAQGHDMWHPFKYINYCDGSVDVFAGYGKEQREWLRKVKKEVVGNERWDVGGFKV